MGNSSGTSKEDPIYDVKKIYWDQDGNLRYGRTDRSRDDEILSILQSDNMDDSDPTKIWMIIPSRWIRQWLLFCHFKVCEVPSKIDMFTLLKQDPTVEGGWRPKKSLKPPYASLDPKSNDHPGHYRRVSWDVWIKLIDLYGVDGYAIAVHGIPVDEKSRWRVFKNPKIIDITILPPPILPPEPDKKDDNKKDDKKKQ